MQKLLLLPFTILIVLAISCGSANKDKTHDHEVRSASTSTFSHTATDTIEVGEVEKSEDEWAQILTPDEYAILREAGTERPYSSDLLDIKKEGVYVCAACGLPLYSSETKFKTGTGWPSFWKPIEPKVVKEVEDRSMGMVRTEIVCAQCESHIGHVFNDGPDPTGLRYCMNGVAMKFKAK
jgi:peptide-methionine (R)-S-oxide reductase